jgi:hypothetical protein
MSALMVLLIQLVIFVLVIQLIIYLIGLLVPVPSPILKIVWVLTVLIIILWLLESLGMINSGILRIR